MTGPKLLVSSHFVLDCKLYADMRKSLLTSLQLDQKYVRLTRKELFTHVMSSKNCNVIEQLCKYVSACFKKREETL